MRLLLLVLLGLLSCIAQARPPGECTLLWISVDGFRPEYIDAEQTPYLANWVRNEVFSDELIPIVPSLTFPSHVSQATGVPVKLHGVSSNTFFDVQSGQVLDFPHQASLVQAESLWATAARQGLEVMVYDWPLSHAQTGPHASRYFGSGFDKTLSDQARLERVLSVWKAHPSGSKLRLVMAYIQGTDEAGHAHGPGSPEVSRRAVEVDALLGEFVEKARAVWENSRAEGDSLVVVLTSDHGMESVHTLIHPWTLLGLETKPEGLAVSGNLANLHLPKASARELDELVDRLRQHNFLQAFRREDLPSEWGYDHPDRVGDIVVLLNPGYCFSEQVRGLASPVEEVGEPLGMHGYVPADCSAMNALLLMRRFPDPFPAEELGPIHSLTLHASFARLLGIEPAEQAAEANVNLP